MKTKKKMNRIKRWRKIKKKFNSKQKKQKNLLKISYKSKLSPVLIRNKLLRKFRLKFISLLKPIRNIKLALPLRPLKIKPSKKTKNTLL